MLPAHINTATPSTEELAEYLITQQLRCYGITTLKNITYLRRNPALRTAVKNMMAEKLASGGVIQQGLPSGESVFIAAELLNTPMPRVNKKLLILSPFDNCVIQRDRLQTLFHYTYQMECYLPEAKRQFGYFCLPLLYGDTFIGRMDCKVHRPIKQLEIKALYFESEDFDSSAMISAFSKAIKPFLKFQQCNTLLLSSVKPKKYLQPLKRALSFCQA